MEKDEVKYYIEKYLRIFGQSGMGQIETYEWFKGAGMNDTQAEHATKQVWG